MTLKIALHSSGHIPAVICIFHIPVLTFQRQISQLIFDPSYTGLTTHSALPFLTFDPYSCKSIKMFLPSQRMCLFFLFILLTLFASVQFCEALSRNDPKVNSKWENQGGCRWSAVDDGPPIVRITVGLDLIIAL